MYTYYIHTNTYYTRTCVRRGGASYGVKPFEDIHCMHMCPYSYTVLGAVHIYMCCFILTTSTTILIILCVCVCVFFFYSLRFCFTPSRDRSKLFRSKGCARASQLSRRCNATGIRALHIHTLIPIYIYTSIYSDGIKNKNKIKKDQNSAGPVAPRTGHVQRARHCTRPRQSRIGDLRTHTYVRHCGHPTRVPPPRAHPADRVLYYILLYYIYVYPI